MDRQAEREERQNALHQQERSENMAIRKEESDYRRANLEEQRAMRLQSHIASLDEKTRAKVKDFSEFRSRGGMAVLSAPPEQRPQAYAMYVQAAKERGYDMSLFPQQWGPATEQRLQFDVDQSKPFADFFSQPTPMAPVGGGAPAPGAPAPNRDQFVQMMMPHALEVSRQTGIDPRLVVAQAALETGFGTAAPGNNFFGIKSHGQPGGQTLATNEAGPGGMVPTRASFRTYQNPGESAQDYAQFLKTNGRYAPVMAAQGLDAQIEAMGKSGYATDPNYGAKLRQIAQGIGGPQPTMGTPPPSLVAQGAGAAPMPNVSPQQAGALPGNPAQMPNGQQFSQAGVIIAQGGGEPGQGDVMTPPRAPLPTTSGGAIEHDVLKQIQLPPGAQIVKRKGAISQPQPDSVEIMYPDGRLGIVRLPKAKEPPAGYRPTAGGGLEPIPGGPGEAASTKQSTEQANKLRDDFRQEPVVKSYRVVVPMLESAKDAGPTRAGDLNLIYAFAKLMDPESVVRESETGMVVASGTVADRLAGLVGQLNGNATLQPETRANLLRELDSRFKAIEASYKEIENAYGEIADSNGVKRSHVILPIRAARKPEEKGAASTPAAPPKVGEVVDGYLFKGGDPSQPSSWEKTR